MADEDKFEYALIHCESQAKIGCNEWMTKDAARRRNEELLKKGATKYKWERVAPPKEVLNYWKPDTLFDK